MSKDGPALTAASPMLYDPIPEGTVQTTKIMQFLAASAGNFVYSLSSIKKLNKTAQELLWLPSQHVCLKFAIIPSIQVICEHVLHKQ